MAANPQTKPNNLGCESAFYYYSARKLILILPSREGGRLSRPRHRNKGVQPVAYPRLYIAVGAMINS